ncbi:MAG: LD-carboxypeptidase [Novosphingobium sp.]|nr:LD-carboxypeptidase [Novosphingobium sp.]
MISRRTMIASSAATVALAATARATPTAITIRKAPRLRAGDTVGLIAPAGFVADRFGVETLIKTVEAMGLVAKPAPRLTARNGYLAGSDETRADDINAMFVDPEVRALFAVRGGWGSQRLLPYLDYDAISVNPKLVIGMSDITALHMALAKHGAAPTIHGPNAAHSWNTQAWDSLRSLAFDGAAPTYSIPKSGADRLVQRRTIHTFRPGKATGRLLGGNLSVLSALVGTPYLPDFAGAILFLEDINEAEYRIDRMLTQLAQGGVLDRVAGVVFGQCTNCRNPGERFGNFTIYEVLDHHFRPLGVPAFQGAWIGHIASQISVPVGIPAEIDAEAGTIRMLEPVVT